MAGKIGLIKGVKGLFSRLATSISKRFKSTTLAGKAKASWLKRFKYGAYSFYAAYEIHSAIGMVSELYVDSKKIARETASGEEDSPEDLEYLASYLQTLSFADFLIVTMALSDGKEMVQGLGSKIVTNYKSKAKIFKTSVLNREIGRTSSFDLGRRTVVSNSSTFFGKVSRMVSGAIASSPATGKVAIAATAGIATVAAILALVDNEDGDFIRASLGDDADRPMSDFSAQMEKFVGGESFDGSIANYVKKAYPLVASRVASVFPKMSQDGYIDSVMNNNFKKLDIVNLTNYLSISEANTYISICPWKILDDTGCVFQYNSKNYSPSALHYELSVLYRDYIVKTPSLFRRRITQNGEARNGDILELVIGNTIFEAYQILCNDHVISTDDISEGRAPGYHANVQKHLDKIATLKWILINDVIIVNDIENDDDEKELRPEVIVSQGTVTTIPVTERETGGSNALQGFSS